MAARQAFAAEPVSAWVERVVIEGAARTREETILQLLPRRPPATYSSTELAEFERRINNLAIFDEVQVTASGARLEVRLREKWTLIPSLEFASGETAADSSALIGVTEFNVLGTANQLSLAVSRAQRGWGVAVAFNEHTYRRFGWSFGADLSYSTAESRFDDGSSWKVRAFEGSVGFTSPPWLSDHLVYRVGAWGVRETVGDLEGSEPQPDSFIGGTQMSFIWDAYEWHDLVPRGFTSALTLGTGLTAADTLAPHDTAEAMAIFALPLGRDSVLTVRVASALVTRGHANSANLIGSIDGVRGLRDGYYHTWLQSHANLELRQAMRLPGRWALQAVMFSDAAAFELMTASGGRGEAEQAYSVGLGLRLIPTWLAGSLLRVDGARLVLPESNWFVQFGLGQYF